MQFLLLELQVSVGEIDKPLITVWGQSEHRVSSSGPLTSLGGKEKHQGRSLVDN